MHKNFQKYSGKIDKKEVKLLDCIIISCFTYFNLRDKIMSS